MASTVKFRWRWVLVLQSVLLLIKSNASPLLVPALTRLIPKRLVEKLLASLAGKTNRAVERAHLDEIRLRRTAARRGKTELIEGPEALRRARTALGQ